MSSNGSVMGISSRPCFRNGKQLPQITPGEAERIEREAASLRLVDLKPKDEPVYTSEADRYESYLEAECTGHELTLDQQAFMRYFETTKMYKKFENRFAFLREQWLVPEDHCSEQY